MARERHNELRLEKLVRRDQTRASETHMATRILQKNSKTCNLGSKFSRGSFGVNIFPLGRLQEECFLSFLIFSFCQLNLDPKFDDFLRNFIDLGHHIGF